mgnify:CR=1 FL=1
MLPNRYVATHCYFNCPLFNFWIAQPSSLIFSLSVVDAVLPIYLFVKFRIDVKVNPLDVEEIVWDIASLSRLNPNQLPPPSMMSLPQGRTDRRKIMVRGVTDKNEW